MVRSNLAGEGDGGAGGGVRWFSPAGRWRKDLIGVGSPAVTDGASGGGRWGRKEKKSLIWTN